MILTSFQLKNLVGAGGGLLIDASSMPLNQLKDICTAANAGGSHIILRRCGELTAEQLAELAQLAPTLLVFDLTS